ncbi:MAG: DUF4290 domain-containing protein [Bacteroidales bacterium]|jgi:hypothetical protein|nr:DUF4290 domain-containing protein [Bacteroidales bacterium]
MNYDYNTQRKKMALPEYGRNVQKMVDHIMTIEDREERNRAARTIIQIMGNLNPQIRDIGDFKHKLWDHLAIIADFKLNIDSPFPQPDLSKFIEKPKLIPYRQGDIRYLHYGRIIELMINAASEMEEGEEKEYLTNLILNQMKKSYVTWNRSQVSDEVIIGDMKLLSGGKLKITEGIKILDVKDLISPVKKKPQQGKSHGKQQNKQFIKKKGYSRH